MDPCRILCVSSIGDPLVVAVTTGTSVYVRSNLLIHVVVRILLHLFQGDLCKKGLFNSIFTSLSLYLLKAELILNDCVVLIIRSKDYLILVLLKSLHRELISAGHGTEVILVPVRGVIIDFTQAVIPFCANILRRFLKGLEELRVALLGAS